MWTFSSALYCLAPYELENEKWVTFTKRRGKGKWRKTISVNQENGNGRHFKQSRKTATEKGHFSKRGKRQWGPFKEVRKTAMGTISINEGKKVGTN